MNTQLSAVPAHHIADTDETTSGVNTNPDEVAVVCTEKRRLLLDWTTDSLKVAGISYPASMLSSLKDLCRQETTAAKRKEALCTALSHFTGETISTEGEELRELLMGLCSGQDQSHCEPAGIAAGTPDTTRSCPSLNDLGNDAATDAGEGTSHIDAPAEERAIDREPRNSCSETKARWMKPDDLQTNNAFSGLFEIRKETKDAIAQSIRAKGFDEANPLVIWRGRKIVIDGHTRLACAKDAELQEVLAVEMDFDNEDEAVRYAIRAQCGRRNITDAEQMRCVEVLDKRQTKAEAGAKAHAVAQGCAGSHGKSAATTARSLGISERKVEQVRTVLDHASPELRAAVEANDMTINKAYSAITKSRRAAEPHTQRAEETVDANAGIQDPGIEDDAGQAVLLPANAPPEVSLTNVAGPAAEDIVMIVFEIIDNASASDGLAACRAAILSALTGRYPTFVSQVQHLVAAPATETPPGCIEFC